MSWRRVNNVLHRDLGYLLVGLTLVYAVSGVAVNHVGDFNPSYSMVQEEFSFAPFTEPDRDVETRVLLDRLGLPEPVDSFRPSPGRILLLYDGWKVEAEPGAGTATSIRLNPRPVLHAINRLHLNHLKGAWTWFADFYAVLLVFMAISGTLVLRGRTGLSGRGKWFVLVGFLFPIAAVILGARAG
jgi:hypothetical protein